MKYNAIIFDLDGVICHTDQYHYKAWKCIADELGVAFDESVNNRLRGVSRMESLEIILEKYNGELNAQEKENLATRKNTIYVELLAHMSPNDLSPAVLYTLDELKKKGLQLAIGSSSRNAQFILKQIGLGNYFDCVSDGNGIKNSKPDPEVFLRAAEQLGQSPQKCMVVEDARAGIEAAVAGGFDSAGIGDARLASGVTYRLNGLGDLLQYT